MYRIEIYHDGSGQWTDGSSLLGQDWAYEDNEFPNELEALNVIDQLVTVGFCRSDLRVVENN